MEYLIELNISLDNIGIKPETNTALAIAKKIAESQYYIAFVNLKPVKVIITKINIKQLKTPL